jgi:hypothetical protein
MASNVKDYLKKLQKKLNESSSYYVYYRDIKKKEYYLIAKERCWEDVVSGTLKKLKEFKKPPKYIIVVDVTINLKNINIQMNNIVGGPLRLRVVAYEVADLKVPEIQSYKGRSQNIWYTKKHLSKRKFAFTDVKKAVKVVNEGEVTQNPFAIVTIAKVLESYVS